MLLLSARVTNFRSISDSEEVALNVDITNLVGKNESGKTAFLQALNRSFGSDRTEKLDPASDYPRHLLRDYRRGNQPDEVVHLTYQFERADLDRVNDFAGFELLTGFEFSWQHRYDKTGSLTIQVPENEYVARRISDEPGLSDEVRASIEGLPNIKSVLDYLEGQDLEGRNLGFLEELQDDFVAEKAWDNRLAWYIWNKFILPFLPRFLYFDDYYILPYKTNLKALSSRRNTTAATDEDRTTLGLLQLAGIDLEDLIADQEYEEQTASLETISNDITDTVFSYWKQNEKLKVEFRISEGSSEPPPYNDGPNLAIRIYDERHRISLPFDQRSKGFIWFFSFIAWFNSVKQQMDPNRDLILLLDEPGLSLHAKAQGDFLKYIENLSSDHQIVYTTHSPFMVDSAHLDRVRVVEDKESAGTKISSNISSSDPSTIFPLQAALGYDIAQNLFISANNLLVEGPADLIYLKFFSEILNAQEREGLKNDLTVVPAGGLDKIATFIALFRGNELNMAVLHDYDGNPDQRLEALVRDKMILKRSVLDFSMFRSGQKGSGGKKLGTDVEDLMTPSAYLRLFNGAYKDHPSNIPLKVSDLPQGDRIVVRISDWLRDNNVTLRSKGGFNHYLPASYLASNPFTASQLDQTTLNNFENLFKAVNQLFPESST